MIYNFNTVDKINIIDNFGKEFFDKVSNLMDSLILKWNINDLKLINSFSANLVFKANSTLYGPVVLKFGRDNKEFSSEVNALKHFALPCVCKVYEVDRDNNVLLMESISPGDELLLENQMEKRLNTFCELYSKLHIRNRKQAASNAAINKDIGFESYKDWIYKITNYMDSRKEWYELTTHMERAKRIYVKLSMQYSKEYLLHGDFHYYNILKGEDSYKIIDPKGVIGDPVFDLPRYMLNEFLDEKDKSNRDNVIEKVFSVLSSELDISKYTLSKLLYIEGAMGICWCVQSGAKLIEKDGFLEILNKLESYILIYKK